MCNYNLALSNTIDAERYYRSRPPPSFSICKDALFYVALPLAWVNLICTRPPMWCLASSAAQATAYNCCQIVRCTYVRPRNPNQF